MRRWKISFSKDGVSLLILLSFSVFLLFQSCEKEGGASAKNPGGTKKDIVLGVLLPITGAFDFLGEDASVGIEFVREDIERQGGISLGGERYSLTYEILDTQGNSERTVGLVQKLINSGKAIGIVGPIMSSLAIPAAGICENAGFPMITPSATNPEVTRGKSYVFRGCFTDDYQGEAVASFLCEEMGIKTALVLFDVSNVYNRYMAQSFVREFIRCRGEVIGEIEYLQGERDFTAEVDTIIAQNPEAVFLPNYRDDINVQVKKLRESGYEGILVGGDAVAATDVPPADQPLFNGLYYCSHFSYDRSSERIDEFIDRYAGKYTEPMSALTPLCYDSVKIFIRAIETAGSLDQEKIVSALAEPRMIEGLTGPFCFDSTGDPKKNAFIVRITEEGDRFFRRISSKDFPSDL